MKSMVRRWLCTVAAAAVLAYVGTVAVTEVKDFALLRFGFLWLCAFALISGALLAMTSDRAFWSMVWASALAAVTLAGLWSYIWWSFLGEHLSYFEVLKSNLFMLHVLPRSAVVFFVTMPLGLLAIVFTKMLIWED
jgi:hypothetical protein